MIAPTAEPVRDVDEVVRPAQPRLGRDDFLRLAARFGGDYLEPPVAYRNGRLVVYRLGGS